MNEWGIHRVVNPGVELKRWRIRRQLSLRALAKRVNCGFSHLAKIENAKATFTEPMARACDQALDAGGALIHAWAAAQGTVRPAQLPPPAPLIGRDNELATLHNAWNTQTRGRPRAIAIDGPAGVGKTSLALAWAHHLADEFVDGHLYADLGAFAPPGTAIAAHAVLERFLSAIGATSLPDTTAERAALYRSLLADRHVLIVLDNIANPDDIAPLLPGTRRCVVVVTSRRTLSTLVVRTAATRVTLRPLAETDSISLISHRIDSIRAAAEPDAVTRLACPCGHLPVALCAAAEHVATYPHHKIAALVNELTGEENLFDAWSFTELRTLFSWTYRALPPDAAHLFRLMGLHRGPSLHLAAAAALAGITQPQGRRLLHQLASLHLVDIDATDMVHIHPLVHAYAQDLVRTDEADHQRRAAARRRISWYRNNAHQAGTLAPMPILAEREQDWERITPLVFANQDEARAWIEKQQANADPIDRQNGTRQHGRTQHGGAEHCDSGDGNPSDAGAQRGWAHGGEAKHGGEQDKRARSGGVSGAEQP
jgi:transcriptional regulator with XRE-family HTH domain